MSDRFQCVEFADISKNEIYFQVEDQDVVSDIFVKGNKCVTKMVLNKHSQYLVVDTGTDEVDQPPLCFEDFNKGQRKNCCPFMIQTYRNTEPVSCLGQVVTLQIDREGELWIVFCSDKGNEKCVNAKLLEQPLPENINSSNHEALFFLRLIEGFVNYYTIESTMWPGWFLTFEGQDKLWKLVLRKKEQRCENHIFLLENEEI